MAGFARAAGLKSITVRHIGAAGYNRSDAATRPSRHLEPAGQSAGTARAVRGRYVVVPVQEEALVLTPEQEAGIEVALESYHQGRVVDSKRARAIIGAASGR